MDFGPFLGRLVLHFIGRREKYFMRVRRPVLVQIVRGGDEGGQELPVGVRAETGRPEQLHIHGQERAE